YLTESSGFKDAALANLSAAEDLKLTQNEKNIIQCAWIAVGVLEGTCAPIEPSNGSSPGGVAGNDAVGGEQGTTAAAGSGKDASGRRSKTDRPVVTAPDDGCNAS